MGVLWDLRFRYSLSSGCLNFCLGTGTPLPIYTRNPKIQKDYGLNGSGGGGSEEFFGFCVQTIYEP